MSLTELIALMPILIIASISVVLMLVVSFVRHHRLTSVISNVGFITAGILLCQQMGTPAVQVTPLLILDDFSRFFVALSCFASVPAVLLAFDYLEKGQQFHEEYYMLLSLALLGAAVLGCSNHFASFFIGIELLSVSLFAMVGYMVHGHYKRASTLEASVKYMILSGVSSSFLLFGVALLYLNFGVLSFTNIIVLTGDNIIGGYATVGAAMILIGLAFKLSWVPFHMWTPDVYQGAPVPVTAFLATVSKVIVFAVAIRFFNESGAFNIPNLITALSVIAVLSIIVGNGLALLQNNLKRLLAYSSIAHLGYLLVAFIASASLSGTSKEFALEAMVFYLVAYIVTSWVAFGVIAILSDPEKGMEAENIQDYKGLLWTRPWIAGFFMVALLSLAGVPLTAGFMGKFYIFSVGITDSLWLLISVVILGSAVGLYYYLKIILEMCKPPETVSDATVPLNEVASIENKVVLFGLTGVILFLGVLPNSVINMIKSVISVLH